MACSLPACGGRRQRGPRNAHRSAVLCPEAAQDGCTAAGVTNVDPEEDPDAQLEANLQRGHRRVESATPGSPEWDAAQANVDDLEHRRDALRPLPDIAGQHVVSRLGPMMLEDGYLIHGVVAALGPDGDALRHEISRIPDRVHSHDEFVHELEAVARRADYIIECENGEREVSFYAWDRELHSGRPATPE